MRSAIRWFGGVVPLLVCLSAVAAGPGPSDAGASPPLLLKLERTGCFGKCPSYRLTVLADGTVEYEGRRYVKVRGFKEAHLDAQKVKALRDAFAQAKFLTVADQFACYEATDLPSAYLTYREGDTERKLKHYYGCLSAPDTLSTLERRIGEIVGTEPWVGRYSDPSGFIRALER